MIQCDHMHFRYQKQSIYQDFHWELSSGSICGFLGPNGAGKTTLFKLLTGLMFPQEGSISVLGHDPKRREEKFYQKIAYVPEDLPIPDMSPETYAQFCGPMYPNYDETSFHHLCDDFEVDRQKSFTHFSAGDLRKAWLSFAFSCKTDLFILDEPSKGLDIHAQSTLRKTLTDIAADGSTILLSTHHVREVEGLLDHVTMINRNGQLLLNAPITDLHKSFRLKRALSKESFPENYLACRRDASGWTLLLNEPSDLAEDIPLELLFTGICRKEKELSDE
ncbi:ABC-2 type transport system ATP-binding protein [Tindallia magadiensis]|uniref:ABC-2 type transport system ATP-binding protein n=1 Tax=Tindallia magadiensis TaxID=69895 RepID=A0A1I3H8G6_9FIRM|nr:ABC transporter ATP-binding protein [Tindallia magadiensis]SFI32026.1 ABC-2 type transport system ATP-binding protein [Tindallia magadiensis]